MDEERRKCRNHGRLYGCEGYTTHSSFCQKCALRWIAKKYGYVMDKEELDFGEEEGFILRRNEIK